MQDLTVWEIKPTVEPYPLRKAMAETVSKILTQKILTMWIIPGYLLSDHRCYISAGENDIHISFKNKPQREDQPD